MLVSKVDDKQAVAILEELRMRLQRSHVAVEEIDEWITRKTGKRHHEALALMEMKELFEEELKFDDSDALLLARFLFE